MLRPLEELHFTIEVTVYVQNMKEFKILRVTSDF